VRNVKQSDPKLRECHILLIDSGLAGPFLDAVRGAPVLTVGNGTYFTEQGGMIDFVSQESTLHFEINFEAAEDARLRISAKLLALARIVKSKRPS
jgi:hypothetical protein